MRFCLFIKRVTTEVNEVAIYSLPASRIDAQCCLERVMIFSISRDALGAGMIPKVNQWDESNLKITNCHSKGFNFKLNGFEFSHKTR